MLGREIRQAKGELENVEKRLIYFVPDAEPFDLGKITIQGEPDLVSLSQLENYLW